MTTNLFLAHAYGDPLVTDWANSQPIMLNTSNHASSDDYAMTCYAEHRRAPSLSEYDRDGQGF